MPAEQDFLELDLSEPPVRSVALQPIPQELAKRQPTTMELLSIALHNKAGIDVIERLTALQERAQAREAEIEFNTSFNTAQNEIGRVARDGRNEKNDHRWASYAAMDKEVRPIYIKHGFCLSWDSEDGREPSSVRAICYVSKGSHTRRYTSPSFSADGTGAKGGGVMSKDEATSSALSFAKRRLLEFIFNIVSEDGGAMDQSDLKERLAYFAKCRTQSEIFEHFKASYVEAEKAKDVRAQLALAEAKDKRKQEIQNERGTKS